MLFTKMYPFKLIHTLKSKYAKKDKFKQYESLVIKNIGLKNIGFGKDAFLLATGPSINGENLNLLQGKDCFTLSCFFLHNRINTINPKIHFFANYHLPLIWNEYVEMLDYADKSLPSTTAIMLGAHTYKRILDEKIDVFSHRKVYSVYFDNCLSTGDVNICTPVDHVQTSPLMVLTALLYMGYENIYLLGCDHDGLRYYPGDVKNFYEKPEQFSLYTSSKNLWPSMIECFDNFKKVFLQYKKYKNLAQQRDINIINLSQNSWLDIFPKSTLLDVIAKN